MPIPAFINDGYEFEGRIHQVSGVPISPEITFKYRPATGPDVQQYYDSMESDGKTKKGENTRSNDAAIRLVTSRLKSWSLPVPISEANLRRLTAPVFNRLNAIILCTDESDPLIDGSAAVSPKDELGNS